MITVDGKTYHSVQEAAKEFGIPISRVKVRLKQGWTPEEAVGLVKRKLNNSVVSIIVENVKYRSVSHAAKHYNIPVTTIQTRLRNSWTIDEAFELVAREPTVYDFGDKFSVVVNGTTIPTLSEACRLYDVDLQTVRSRLARNWTLEEALNLTQRQPKHGYPGIIYLLTSKTEKKSYVGVTMRKIDERWDSHIQKAYANKDVNPEGGILDAIVRLGVSDFEKKIIYNCDNHVSMQTNETRLIKELNTLYPQGYNLNLGGSGSVFNVNHQIRVNGKVYPSVSRAMSALNIVIPYQTVVDRITRYEWTPEEAFGLVPHAPKFGEWGSYKARTIIVEGKEYRSLAEACRAYPDAPDVKLVQNRLTRNWTPEEALNIVPHEDQRGRGSHKRVKPKTTMVSNNTSGYRGVTFHQQSGRWHASLQHNGERQFIGSFATAEKAHEALEQARAKLS